MIDTCKYCGSKNLKFTKTDGSIHYGRIDCGHCNKFLFWQSNPNKEESNRKNKKSCFEVSKFHDFNNEFCFICLRGRDELGEHETLEVDHIEELNKGGKDAIQNMQVLCSACHKLKNWCRLYMNWHNKEGKKEDDSTST